MIKLKQSGLAGLTATIMLAGTAQAQGSISQQVEYPIRALREGREGTVTFRLVISETGRPESCVIIESSGSPDLDRATCESMMRREKFQPAADADGKPVKGTFISKSRWTIQR